MAHFHVCSISPFASLVADLCLWLQHFSLTFLLFIVIFCCYFLCLQQFPVPFIFAVCCIFLPVGHRTFNHILHKTKTFCNMQKENICRCSVDSSCLRFLIIMKDVATKRTETHQSLFVAFKNPIILFPSQVLAPCTSEPKNSTIRAPTCSAPQRMAS